MVEKGIVTMEDVEMASAEGFNLKSETSCLVVKALFAFSLIL